MSTIEPVAGAGPGGHSRCPDTTSAGTDANDVWCMQRTCRGTSAKGFSSGRACPLDRARADRAPYWCILNPTWGVVYYLGLLLVGFAAIGWAQLKIGRVGQLAGWSFSLMFCSTWRSWPLRSLCLIR